MHHFGAPCTFVSRVGKDRQGEEILEFIERSLGTATVQVDRSHETGTVQVGLDQQGVPDFTIVKDVAYDYIEYTESVEKAMAQGPGLIYFGTLGQRNSRSRETLKKILDRKKAAKILYDMNLRKESYTREIVEASLEECHIVKLNDSELQTCRALFSGPPSDGGYIPFLMKRFDLEWLCLTRGAEGSELFNGETHVRTGPIRQQTVIDTVGAGDAYTAILALGILGHWSPETILSRASEFAGSVCAIEGGIPANGAFYDPYLPWLNRRDHESS
jgi:fructokinase